jgi:PQQ-dependent catabolism-associated CXXCW motif protein
MTNNNKEVPLIFYCQSNQCWMSYNAALRAIHMGYTNVLWYRGGLEAWKAAGQPVHTAYQGYAPPPGAGNKPY